MQRMLSFVLLASLAAACGRTRPSAGQESTAAATELSSGIVDPYLKINTALAADSIDGVKANAGDIATAASSLGPFAFRIGTSAVQLASAADLADARTKLGALSEAIDAYMATQHLAPPAGIRVAFCPMVMKPWLQKDGPLRNPYYGSQMLTCGSFRN